MRGRGEGSFILPRWSKGGGAENHLVAGQTEAQSGEGGGSGKK